MKTMKSYRMDDTILGMLSRIKKAYHCTDTKAIEWAIMELYYSDKLKKLEEINETETKIGFKFEKPHEDT